jgi:N-ethylmaleimide reductase
VRGKALPRGITNPSGRADADLQNGSNKRSDAYGGPAENRARLMIETTQAMIQAWDAAHVGVRLSPSSYL